MNIEYNNTGNADIFDNLQVKMDALSCSEENIKFICRS